MATTFDSVNFLRERPNLMLYLADTWEFLGWIYENFSSYWVSIYLARV